MSKILQHDALDAETVAGLLGVSTRQLSNYIKIKGLPSSGDGRGRTFNWPEVLTWYVEYKVSIDRYLGNDGSEDGEESDVTSGKRGYEDLKKSERRRASAMADLKEIELDKVRGSLVPMEEVSKVLQTVAKGLQNEIRGFPTRVSGQALTCRTHVEMFTLLSGECENLCKRLSQLKFPPEAERAEEDLDA